MGKTWLNIILTYINGMFTNIYGIQVSIPYVRLK